MDDGADVHLPECSSPFLLETFREIGPALGGGMSAAPIGWRDVEAWQACVGVRLPPWQSRLLISLSREFVAFSRTAEDPRCRAPWEDEDSETRRDRVSRQLKSAFSALIVRKDR